MRFASRLVAVTTLAAVAGAACRSVPSSGAASAPDPDHGPAPAGSPANRSEMAAIAKARADSARLPYTAADIHFMSGMIGHHAQAITMAGWCPSHGASRTLQTLCERIINAQQDEIATMQRWLEDRRQPVPRPDASGMHMDMGGMQHTMLMPGMLTPEQMTELDAARGTDFDRLFLTYMIQHHRGALTMVKDLFATPGAGQDELAFKLATDVNVDQTTEIARMERMLAILKIQGQLP
jgi:uncharacterized protein (DUF305 family)